MKHLKNYIDNKNKMLAMFNPSFGRAQYTFPLSQNDVDSIAQDLDCAMSPENLHCDGEISRSAAGSKERQLRAVAKDLEMYCSQNNKIMQELYEF